MFMVLKEDVQNLMFKCEKIIEATEIKLKRLKKEEKMLAKVLKDYTVSEDNSIIFNEINSRYLNVIQEIDDLKINGKSVKRILSKIRPLLTSMEVVEGGQTEDNIAYEVEDNEIGQLE